MGLALSIAVVLSVVVCFTDSVFADETTAEPQAATTVSIEQIRQLGEKMFSDSCADCHGEKGEGVEDVYDDPLIGDDSIGQLAEIIEETMPEGSPEDCVGEDARAIAEYIHFAFYSRAAQIRNRPPRAAFARLTGNQLRQSISDLYSSVAGLPRVIEERGIQARYYDGDRAKKDKLKQERVDPVIDFDFGREAPVEGVKPEAFYIQWEGGLLPAVSGKYEIVVRSSCSFVFELGRDGRELINNHVQSGDKTEFRRTIQLTAGRVYPLEIRFIQRKRKTEIPPARISLSWVPPGGVEEVIGSRHLIPQWVPPAYALQTEIPPDDRTYGYERGIAVSRQWDESTTLAALEFAQIAFDELWPDFRRRNRKMDDADRGKLKAFLTEILERAFRGKLSDEQRELYINKQIDKEPDDAEAIKRVILLALKSPRFLYPATDIAQSKSQRIANHLGLVLFDALPDDRLRKAASEEKLSDAESIRRYVRASLDDFRVRAKTRDMLWAWLGVPAAEEISKDDELYPGFTRELVQDLEASLDAFMDDVVWSEPSDFRRFFTSEAVYTTPRMAAFYGERWQPAFVPKPEVKDSPNSPDTEGVQAQESPDEEKSDKPEPQVQSADGAETEAEDSEEYDAAEDTSNDEQQDDSAAAETPQPAPKRATNLGPVRSVDSDQRYGLLSHPYLLSRFSYHDTSSPIHRGLFLIRNMLGRTLRPPADAFSPLSPDLHPDLTTRERVDLQTSPASCQVCHSKINGLGFTLENYDAVGRFRESERGKSIDSSGKYVSRGGDEVEFAGTQELADYLVGSDDSHQAFVARAFQHFVKQPPAAFGADTLEKLTERFRESEFNVRELIVEIAVVSSKRLLDQKPPEAATEVAQR